VTASEELLLVALPAYQQLREDMLACGPPSLARGECAFERFAGGELRMRLQRPVTGRRCAVLGSLAPPDTQLLSVLLAADTLRREGAHSVIAALPYIGYARQDRPEPGCSAGAQWCGRLLRAAGVDRVVTLDVHSERAELAFELPIQSLSPAQLFAAALAREPGLDGLTLVAPDEGAVERCEALRLAAGIAAPVALLRKRRDARGVHHGELSGEPGRRVALVDDILDTGSTLVSACEVLHSAGVVELVVCVTHALFVGERWRALSELGVRRIYTTDSSPQTTARGGELVRVLATGPLLAAALGG
jgi:ribose-phosphate pyrophosphokinase